MKKLFATDFDGTLLSRQGISSRALRAFVELRQAEVVRVIATGRSLYSFQKAAPPSLDFDYLIFSTGAGVLRISDQRLLAQHTLHGDPLQRVLHALQRLNVDHFVQAPIPENHRFVYHQAAGVEDFHRRLALYQSFAAPLIEPPESATQVIAVVEEADTSKTFNALQTALPDLALTRTTSPIDGHSGWIEIFPPGVSKSCTTAWLCDQLEIPYDQVAAIGNDYNDLDLLEWAPRAFVVSNASKPLLERFEMVPSAMQGGVADAIARWRHT